MRLLLAPLLLSASAPAPSEGIARSDEPALDWAGADSIIDLPRFPDERSPGWLRISLPVDRSTTGGAVGLVIWAEDGAAAGRFLVDGRRPPHHPQVWTIDPPEDGRGGPPGYLRFAVFEAPEGAITVPARLAVQGPERPLRIEIAWWCVDTASGSDTMAVQQVGEASTAPFVTVLGGPASIRRGAVLHAIAPRVPKVGESVRLLGSDLQRIANLQLVDADGTGWDVPATAGAASRTWRVPAVPPGPAHLLLDGSRAAFASLRVRDSDARGSDAGGSGVGGPGSDAGGAHGRDGPLWDQPDGDVLLVAADDLYDALGPLRSDLAARGYRPAAASLGSLTSVYGTPGECAIRCAVSDACLTFRSHPIALILVGSASEDVPANDAVATEHVPYEHEFPGFYDATYAEDAAFGDLTWSPDPECEVPVGRIPARTAGEVAGYVAKLQAYRAQTPRSSILLAVGDASINHDNRDRARAAAALLATVQQDGAMSGEAQYASSYVPLTEMANRQRALMDFQNRLAGGVGLLGLFGNNSRATNIVHFLECPPGPVQPWVLPEEMPTEGKLPIALFHTCLNGAFDEDGLFAGYDSPAETWIRDPNRGAIACIAQSHVTTFFDDWELADRFLRRLARRDGALLGALHAGARWDLLSQAGRGGRSEHSVRMCNLLGDPLLEPRLGITQKRLEGSFESSGSLPAQNRLCRDRGWTTTDLDTTCATARIVYGGVQPPAGGGAGAENVYPVAGARMLRITGFHEPGSGRRAAAWTVFRCDLLIERGSVLSYWIRQDADPRGIGRLSLDAVTESGRVLSRELLDLSGRRTDPQGVHYPLGVWRRVTVRLDPWAGERIRGLFVRYDDPLRPGDPPRPFGDRRTEGSPGAGRPAIPEEEPFLPGGVFSGYLDQVVIETGYSDPLVDGDFAVDEDRDRRPDYWLSPVVQTATSESGVPIGLQDDGPTELWIDPAAGEEGGVRQLLGPFANPAVPQYLRFEGRSNEGARLRISVGGPATGSVLEQKVVGPLGAGWEGREALLCTATGGAAILSLSAVGGRLALRSLRFESSLTTDLGAEAAPSPHDRVLRIGPNPSSGTFHLTWARWSDCPNRIQLLDLAGRRIAEWSPSAPERGRMGTQWSPHDDHGERLPSGAYFLRIVWPSATETRTVQVVR